jgi:hypothetical protein
VRPRERHSKGEDVLRLEAGIHVEQAHEAAHEEAGAGDEDDRQRDFDDDERGPQPLAGGGRGPARPVLQRPSQREP